MSTDRARRARAGLALALVLAAAALAARPATAVTLDLGAVSCDAYQNQLLASKLPGYAADPIDTVMWLFGFSVARSGERVMYNGALTAFGFALDAECKNHPQKSVLEAVTGLKSKRENPMDLTRLDCGTFETRHSDLQKSDPESANTLTMWLFGFATGIAGHHDLNPDAVQRFDAGLQDWCTRHPTDSVFDALAAPNPAIPAAPAARAAPQRQPRQSAIH